MNKQLKRPLALTKETLRSLTDVQLGRVAGGGVAQSVYKTVHQFTCACNVASDDCGGGTGSAICHE